MNDPAQSPPVRSVLLAEDHDVTRIGMTRFLRDDLGVPTIEGYATFDEAIARLRSQAFDLAIFDLGIPGLSSNAQLRNVRILFPKMRLVVMSGSDRRSDILAALGAGAHGYIVKTTPMAEVAERLAFVMAGGIFVPPSLADVSLPDGADATGSPERSQSAGGDNVRLTRRQIEVLAAMYDGLTNKKICELLDIAEGTVKMHVTGLYKTLGVNNRAQAVIAGQRFLPNAKPGIRPRAKRSKAPGTRQRKL